MKRIFFILLLVLALLLLYGKYKQSKRTAPNLESPPPASAGSGPASTQSESYRTNRPASSALPKIKQLAIEQELEVLDAREEEAGWISITVATSERHMLNQFLNELERTVTLQDFEGGQPKGFADRYGRRRYEATYRLKVRVR
jgi:hypothetical protein